MSVLAKEALAVVLILLCTFGVFLGIDMGLLTMYGDNPAFLLISPTFLIGSAIGLIKSRRWFHRLRRQEEMEQGK
jgi:hypothetical protein